MDLIRVTGTITGALHVVSEGPIFRAIFPMVAHGDSILGGLVGDLGKRLAESIITGDRIFFTGKFIQEANFGKIFVIHRACLTEEQSIGRNLNVVA